MPGAGVVASKVRKQRAAAQSLKGNKDVEGGDKKTKMRYVSNDCNIYQIVC